MTNVLKSNHDKSMEDQVNEFLQVLANHPVDSTKITPFEQRIMKLNAICGDIFRVTGSVAKATGAFIFGESDPNQTPRGESPHLED